MKLAARYAIVVGFLILAQWGFFLATGNVPELRTEPIRISIHLAAEAVTALALIIAGWAALQRKAWGRSGLLVALGMLIYTMMVSPGYFAQRGQWLLVAMFAALLVLALGAILQLLQAQ